MDLMLADDFTVYDQGLVDLAAFAKEVAVDYIGSILSQARGVLGDMRNSPVLSTDYRTEDFAIHVANLEMMHNALVSELNNDPACRSRQVLYASELTIVD